MNMSGTDGNLIGGEDANESIWLLNRTKSDFIPLNTKPNRFHQPPLVAIIFCCVRLTLFCVSCLLNYFLIGGVSATKYSTLKAKFVILSVGITNITLPLSLSIDVSVLGAPFGKMDKEVTQCFTCTFFALQCISLFAQSFCSLALACDRLYAVVQPMKYRTIGYHKCIRILMIISPWLVALLMYMAATVSPLFETLAFPQSYSHLCSAIFRSQRPLYASSFLGCALLILNSSSFAIYIIIFAVLRYSYAKTNSAFEMAVRKNSLALSVTYLMANVTTVLLYSPAPIYNLLAKQALGQAFMKSKQSSPVLKALPTLYLMNCVLVPVILVYRIPSIRRHLPFKNVSPCQTSSVKARKQHVVSKHRDKEHSQPAATKKSLKSESSQGQFPKTTN